MPLHPNSQILVDTLQALPLLDGRFSQIKLVNYDAMNNEKRGTFSLIFKAQDIATGNPVALKFYDIDPALQLNTYRRAGFEREQAILETLVTKNRCLQLVSGLRNYDLKVSGSSLTVRCMYFAIEWLEEDIDKYFLSADLPAIAKLKVFREIVLAVDALHRNEVFHRDLKADNMRVQEAMQRTVVAIDLGTAAQFSSGKVAPDYGGGQAGHSYYAPLEARCGLAGNRKIAHYSDYYAIGCLLYELFNIDLFIIKLIDRNNHYDMSISAMSQDMSGIVDETEQIKTWDAIISKFSNGIIPVPIEGVNNCVPAGIVPILNELLTSLTHADYKKRPKGLKVVMSKVDSALRVLGNQSAYTKRLTKIREDRKRREQKILLASSKSQALFEGKR